MTIIINMEFELEFKNKFVYVYITSGATCCPGHTWLLLSYKQNEKC